MLHIDLFSGIGGFALAVDKVFSNTEHIFCDIDPFCQRVLKKHWPNSKIYGDIRQLITNSEREGLERGEYKTGQSTRQNTLLTGGFPCQPFSQAGQRKGTADDRYLWPQMFRVIQLTKPTWVIAENVSGLVTWNEGMVLEQVCIDLESEGYEVQPFIIPAVAKNAPHRRDRVWIVGHSKYNGQYATQNRDITQNPISERSGGRDENTRQVLGSESPEIENERPSWEKNWVEVAAELCGVDDGLPVELDGFKLTKAKHRAEQLKAYGNAIVPQVAIEILKAIKAS